MATPPLPLPIGIRIGPSSELARPAAVQMAAQAAERLGYAAVWAISEDPAELVRVAADAARATDRMRIGVGLLVGAAGLRTGQRDALATLRQVAPGRLTLGIAVATELSPAVAAHVVTAVRGASEPTGAPAPRVVLSARSPEGFDLLARRADGWIADGTPLSELAGRWEALVSLATTHRRGAEIALVVPARVGLMDEALPAGRADYHGDVRQVADDVLAAARAGAEEVVLMPTGSPSLDELLDVCARVAEALEVQLSTPSA